MDPCAAPPAGCAAERIELAPHCALSVRGARLFFGAVCAGSFAVAGFVALQGFWPVMPFAGAEMALFGWALKSNMDRRHQRETILICDDEVRIERRPARARAPLSQVVFQRHWARVKLSRARTPLHPSRLTIESHGRACEVGQFLTEAERRGIARQLKSAIGRVSESPPLAVG